MSGFVGLPRARRTQCRKKRAVIRTHAQDTTHVPGAPHNPKFKHSNLAGWPRCLGRPLPTRINMLAAHPLGIPHRKGAAESRSCFGEGRMRVQVASYRPLPTHLTAQGQHEAPRNWNPRQCDSQAALSRSSLGFVLEAQTKDTGYGGTWYEACLQRGFEACPETRCQPDTVLEENMEPNELGNFVHVRALQVLYAHMAGSCCTCGSCEIFNATLSTF